MEKKIVKVAEKELTNFAEKKISRKDAIKRTAYVAASAATMMILLSSPSQANGPNASQPAPPPQKGDNGNHGGNGPWH